MQPWSNAPIDISGLNYVDAQVRISAAELNIGDARFAPAAVDATVASGVMKTSFSHLGAYDGQANGVLSIDASTNNPSYALQADVTGVRALPLLSSLADFGNVDGKMQAKADVRGTGAGLRAIMSSFSGTASVGIRDGAIRNLNLPKVIRALTSGTFRDGSNARTRPPTCRNSARPQPSRREKPPPAIYFWPARWCG